MFDLEDKKSFINTKVTSHDDMRIEKDGTRILGLVLYWPIL